MCRANTGMGNCILLLEFVTLSIFILFLFYFLYKYWRETVEKLSTVVERESIHEEKLQSCSDDIVSKCQSSRGSDVVY